MRSLLAVSILAGAVLSTVAVLPAAAGEVGEEGCSPGYWKNHPESWQEWYTPSSTAGEAFKGLNAPWANVTLMAALQGGGGPGIAGAQAILLRAGTTAVLNAAHDGVLYPLRRYDPDFLVNQVRLALNSESRSQMLSLAEWLDGLNNLGCPL